MRTIRNGLVAFMLQKQQCTVRKGDPDGQERCAEARKNSANVT
jgi:hypothetical protein